MKLRSRKLWGGIILIVLATIIALTETMTAGLFSAWGNFVFLIFSAYVIGNVGTKVAHSLKNKMDGTKK